MVAPLAVKVVLWPAQMAVVPAMATTGLAFCTTVTVAEAEQPFASVPVTENVPAAFTEMAAVLAAFDQA